MTKRLNKTECNEIAFKMVAPISNEIEECKKFFEEVYKKKAEELVPKEVLELFNNKKTKPFIKTEYGRYIYIKNNNRSIYISCKNIPYIDKNIVLIGEEAEEANKVYDKLEILKSKKLLLIKELEQVLFKLGTYNRVSEHLPEAVPYLPENREMLPQINLNEFREKLRRELN